MFQRSMAVINYIKIIIQLLRNDLRSACPSHFFAQRFQSVESVFRIHCASKNADFVSKCSNEQQTRQRRFPTSYLTHLVKTIIFILYREIQQKSDLCWKTNESMPNLKICILYREILYKTKLYWKTNENHQNYQNYKMVCLSVPFDELGR